MSTKIYNGIKFKSKNIKEVLDQLISIKGIAKEIAVKSISDEELSFFIGANRLLDKDVWDISKDILESIDSTDSRLHFKPNLRFSVIIYPTNEGDIYGYYFDSDKKEYRELIEPFYTDFHYQDQSDKPDDISDEDWEFRGQKWNELVDYKFKDTGFTYEIVTGDDFSIMDILKRVKIIVEKLKRDDKINQVIDK